MSRLDEGQFEVFVQVRDFGAEFEVLFPKSSRGAQLLGVVADVIAQLDALGLKRAQAARSSRQGKSESRQALRRWMGDLARTSRDVARTRGTSEAALVMPPRRSDAGLVSAARLFVEISRPFSADLIERGIPADWEPAFVATIDALDAQIGQRRAARSGVSSSKATIAKVKAEGRAALKSLDVIVANVAKDNAGALAAWQRARRPSVSRAKASSATVSEPIALTSDDLPKAS